MSNPSQTSPTDEQMLRASMASGVSSSIGLPSQARLITPTDSNDELDSGGFKKSNHERAFSDFGIDGSEKDNIQIAKEASEQQFEAQKNKEKEDDLRDVADFIEEQQEARQEFMFNINGHQFSNEALDETIKEAVKDVDAWADKNGISKEEAQSDVAFMMSLEEASPEEREQMIKDRIITHPASMERILLDADLNETKLENKAYISETKIVASEADAVIAEMENNEGSFEAITKAPSTGKSDIFNSFADTSSATPDIEIPKIPTSNNIFDRIV